MLVEKFRARGSGQVGELTKRIPAGNQHILAQHLADGRDLCAFIALEKDLPGNICHHKGQLWCRPIQAFKRIGCGFAGRFDTLLPAADQQMPNAVFLQFSTHAQTAIAFYTQRSAHNKWLAVSLDP